MDLFKYLQKMLTNRHIKDLHSFTANCKKCTVVVEAREVGDFSITENYYNGKKMCLLVTACKSVIV